MARFSAAQQPHEHDAEGFLICRDAVFARTGTQEYRGEEVMNVELEPNVLAA